MSDIGNNSLFLGCAFIFSVRSFRKPTILNFDEVLYDFFPLRLYILCPEKSLPVQNQRFSLVLSFRSFIILLFCLGL